MTSIVFIQLSPKIAKVLGHLNRKKDLKSPGFQPIFKKHLKHSLHMNKTILIVDDEQDIVQLLAYNLKKEGYRTLEAFDGLQALAMAARHRPDLVLLDVMLPGRDGWDVLRTLRGEPETAGIPVIFLTAKDSEIDQVVGLELGAHDYIVKPVSMRILLARVKTILRTVSAPMEPEPVRIAFGTVTIDPPSYTVQVADVKVPFTKKEFDILLYLTTRPGRVIDRDTLLTQIWGSDVMVIDRTVDVHIRKIREKLGAENSRYIETLKGVGYRFKSDE
jgi:two-component system, OmpR family, alkaline phosphatase synthesis response regulator PhoP